MEERGAPLPGRTGSLSEKCSGKKEKFERMKEGMKKVDEYANASGFGVSFLKEEE